MNTNQDYLEKVIGALLKRFASRGLTLSNEEIEDAPDIEFRDLFETDQVEMRMSTYGKTNN